MAEKGYCYHPVFCYMSTGMMLQSVMFVYQRSHFKFTWELVTAV